MNDETFICPHCKHTASEHDNGGCTHACTCSYEFLGALSWSCTVEHHDLFSSIRCTCGWQDTTYVRDNALPIRDRHFADHALAKKHLLDKELAAS